MIIGIQDEILRINSLGLLDRLLADKTTKANILWATDAYSGMGSDYQRDKEIKAPLITGEHSGIIKNRARKALEQQFERTRQHAEVFTPLWVCAKMNDYADEVWFGKPDIFTKDGEPTERVEFPKGKSWQRYVDSRRLEITCGEAPYLVSRYDVSTGESIPIERRIGLLDRKLRVVNENTVTEDEWLKWALRAFQSTYGYEFQGDNVLISRVNLLTTFEEYLTARWKRKPTKKEYEKITNIIAWNLWQMDGLTSALPYCKAEDEYRQLSIFDWLGMNENVDAANTQPRCRIMNWLGGRSVEFINLPIRGNHGMKFDFIIGNPPYQDETLGDNKGFAPPIYHLFLEEAYKISDRVELIHPARFLFNAGSTPKAWNQKMLSDPHLKVIYFEQDGSKLFPNTEIKGGIAITCHDKAKNYGAIGTFTAFPELNSILRKAAPKEEKDSLVSIIFIQNRFNLDALYAKYPQFKGIIGSNGKDKRFRNNIFDKIPLFSEQRGNNDDICVLGVINNKRVWRYFPIEFLETEHENIYCWKVLVPRVSGSGAIGEVLSNPLVVGPLTGYTQTFIGIGAFETEKEAEACLKYIKSKFARTMLAILKITQDNNRDTWRMIPIQDFTPMSDIDWSKSIPEIDQQFYAKYGLDESEIAFIESHVKEMK